MVRIIRWKYSKKISACFVADVMRIVSKHNLWSYIQAFLEDGTFPTKVHWKRVIVKAINNTENICGEKKLHQGVLYKWIDICEFIKS